MLHKSDNLKSHALSGEQSLKKEGFENFKKVFEQFENLRSLNSLKNSSLNWERKHKVKTFKHRNNQFASLEASEQELSLTH